MSKRRLIKKVIYKKVLAFMIRCTQGSRKKSSSLNCRAIKALHPPPCLMAIGTNNKIKIKVQKKLFFLNGLDVKPPPPLIGPAIKRITFFAASLTISDFKSIFNYTIYLS